MLAFPTPALRKVREGRGTRRVADASAINSLDHPPANHLKEAQRDAAEISSAG